MHTNFATGNVSVKAKDEHVINAIFNAIFKNTDEWTNSFRVEDKPEMKQEGLEYRKFAYYGEIGCDQSVFLFMVNADRMLKLWMPKIHDFLVANEFTISFKFVNCCVRAQLLVGMTIEIHHNADCELTNASIKIKDKTLFDFDETNITMTSKCRTGTLPTTGDTPARVMPMRYTWRQSPSRRTAMSKEFGVSSRSTKSV